MGRRAVLSAAGVAVYTATFGACLDDLPDATTCPAPARIAGSSCVAAINEQRTKPQCFDTMDVECLAGPRPNDGCVPDECPESAAACWPDGDCPPTVIERVGEDTTCRRLSGEAYGLDLTSELMCMHRCASCAAVCDGIGPVLGMLNAVDTSGNSTALPLFVEIGSRMPDEGKLGIYMRVRGLANFQVIIGRGQLDDLSQLEFTGVGYFVLTPLGTGFVEQVLYADSFLGIEPYAWSRHEDRPTVIVVFPPGDETGPGLALYEIDCIVPFVVD